MGRAIKLSRQIDDHVDVVESVKDKGIMKKLQLYSMILHHYIYTSEVN